MKYLLLPFLLFFALTAQAQTSVSNFQVVNGSLIYQQVFEQDVTKEDLFKYLMGLQSVAEVEQKDNFITAKVDRMKIDYRKHGGKWGSTPAVLNFLYSGSLMAELKDGRYRITVSNITYDQPNATMYQNTASNLHELVLDKQQEFRRGKNYLAIIHYIDKHWTDVFTAQEQATASDDW